MKTVEVVKQNMGTPNIRMPALPYAFDALAPYISADTLKLHYKKHNKSYVDRLNTLKRGTDYNDLTLKEIVLKSSYKTNFELDRRIFNNASQAWNHAFYWQCMSAKHNQAPSKSFQKILIQNFESLDAFKSQFIYMALGLFGSGWTWLVKNSDQTLEIFCGDNAESPLAHGKTPLLVCDVWEHAYYLDYKNERKEYLENFWRLINWPYVERCLSYTIPNMEV